MTLPPFEYKAKSWEDTDRGKIVVIRVPRGHLFPELNQTIIIDDQLWVIQAINSFVPPREEVALLVR
jgi:hypothetical protein